MKFSQTIGLTSIKKELQLEDLDNDLKNRLWNVYKTYILDRIDNKFQFTDEKQMFTRLLWHQYFKKRLDDIPKYFSISVLNIRSYYFSKTTEWYQVYDLIEVSAQIAESQPVQINTNDFFETANSVLESEFAGYRFINKMLSPITNQSEINSINDSLHKTLQFSSVS